MCGQNLGPGDTVLYELLCFCNCYVGVIVCSSPTSFAIFFTQVDDQATRGCLQDSEDSSRGCVARRWMNYFVALSLLPKKMIFMSSHDVVTAFVI
jgi:hypothetical protein